MKKCSRLILIVSILSLMLVTYASARASDQIDGGWAVAQASSGGEIAVEFQINGTGKMSKIGASLIVVYEKGSNGWTEFDRITASDDPSLFTTGAYSHCRTKYFHGVVGRQYYAKVTTFATNSSGTDYRTYTTSIVVAK